MATGEMSEAEFTGFLASILKQLGHHSVNGAIHFICMDWLRRCSDRRPAPRVHHELGRARQRQTQRLAAHHAISGFMPIAVRSITSRNAKEELILVTCGIVESHSLWMRS